MGIDTTKNEKQFTINSRITGTPITSRLLQDYLLIWSNQGLNHEIEYKSKELQKNILFVKKSENKTVMSTITHTDSRLKTIKIYNKVFCPMLRCKSKINLTPTGIQTTSATSNSNHSNFLNNQLEHNIDPLGHNDFSSPINIISLPNDKSVALLSQRCKLRFIYRWRSPRQLINVTFE